MSQQAQLNPKTLVIVAHPALHDSSRVNQKLANICHKHVDTVHDLYAKYPDGKINILHEQQLLLQHDRVIFQFPVWWYSCPSLLKEWLDVVLTYGWAYGEGGDKLHGKQWGLAVTAGGSKQAYCAEGYNLYPLEQLLRPFEVTASIVGANYLSPFIVYNAMELDEQQLELKANEYIAYLTAGVEVNA